MLEHADGSGALADYLRNVFHVEIGEYAQQNDLGLIPRKGGEPGESRPRRGECHDFVCTIGCLEVPHRFSRDRVSPTACGRATVVEQPAAGDCEDPSSECCLIAVEPLQATRDVEPSLGGQVFRVPSILGLEVAQDSWMEIAVERRECPFGACPGSGEDGFELATQPHGTMLSLRG
jgi:hypothetical protein